MIWATKASQRYVEKPELRKVRVCIKGPRKNNFRFSHPICTTASAWPQSRNLQCSSGYTSNFAQSPRPTLRHIWARKTGSYSCASPNPYALRSSRRKPHLTRRLPALATKPGEICGLTLPSRGIAGFEAILEDEAGVELVGRGVVGEIYTPGGQLPCFGVYGGTAL